MIRIARKVPPRVARTELSGRTCLVTGASSGIGFETARALALMGAKVFVVGRTPSRVEESCQRLRTEKPDVSVHGLVSDFACLAEVAELAMQIRGQCDRLDVLVNNAGIWNPTRLTSAQGHEQTFAVNHLAPFALTWALLPLLKRGRKPRVVTVSSRLHRKARDFDFADPHQQRRRYSGMRAYQQSKLANVLFSRELASKNRDWLKANAVHPGDVATNVVRQNRLLSWGIRTVGKLWLLQPEEGARTSVYVATSPEIDTINGAYFSYCQAVEPSPAACDPQQAKRLWELSQELVQPFVQALG